MEDNKTPGRPYEIVSGLEVHVELATKTKVWCSCSTEFGAAPNTQTCPVCLALPGVLPVLNEQALEFAVRAALALNCEIQPYSKFDRKNYFYADNPKAYQISQYDLPFALGGWVEIEAEGQTKRIGITRIHLEEDAGKLLHAEGGTVAEGTHSLVDFNRAGVPLIEIVSEPDLRSPEEASAYLKKLRTILQYTGVSDVKMEEGSMRCDVNTSVRPWGAEEFGTRTELKNLSSFRMVERGMRYEAERQWEILAHGGTVDQETRSWDEAKGVSVLLRSKEDAHDYRYFPEPDLPPVVVDAAYIEQVRATLPELPDARKTRYMQELGLSAYDAGQITGTLATAKFYDQAVEAYRAKNPKAADPAKTVANWLINEIFRLLNAQGLNPEELKVKPEQLADLLLLIDQGTITGKIAKTVIEEMVGTGKDPGAIVKEKGLVQIADAGELKQIALQVVRDNPKAFDDWKGGKASAAGFLMGQLMKATRGRANPELANRLIQEALQQVAAEG